MPWYQVSIGFSYILKKSKSSHVLVLTWPSPKEPESASAENSSWSHYAGHRSYLSQRSRVSLLRNRTSIWCMKTDKIPWVCKWENNLKVSNHVLKWWYLWEKNVKQSHRSKTVQYKVHLATRGLLTELP